MVVLRHTALACITPIVVLPGQCSVGVSSMVRRRKWQRARSHEPRGGVRKEGGEELGRRKSVMVCLVAAEMHWQQYRATCMVVHWFGKEGMRSNASNKLVDVSGSIPVRVTKQWNTFQNRLEQCSWHGWRCTYSKGAVETGFREHHGFCVK